MMNYWKSYEKKRKKENGWLLLVMCRGVELKLVCTKYLKKIQACITQEFKSEISKRKISRTQMNKISTTMSKKFKSTHEAQHFKSICSQKFKSNSQGKNLKITHEQNFTSLQCSYKILHKKLQWAKSKEITL
jgi:hypothetical protein